MRLKDFFIPHEGNDYKPHSLQKAAVYGMMGLVLLSFALANVQSLIWISSDWMVSTILPSVIVDLTNEERQDDSLVTLRRNSVLDAAAQLKAQHMASNQYFAHYSPDGISPWYWFGQAGYNFVHAGENLAIHFKNSDDVVEAWMDSPTHRANILDGDFTEIGVGAVEGTYQGYKTVYVVQLFGTPAATQAPIQTASFDDEAESPVSNDTVVATSDNADPLIAGSEGTITEVDDTTVSLSTDREPVAVSSELAQADTKDEYRGDEDVVVTEDSVALYSDLVSTSTGGVPATIEPPQENSNHTNKLLTMATQPQTVLQILYTLIGLFVIGSLLLSVLIEIRKQQPVQIAYSAGLMTVMAALFYVHALITNGVLIV